MTDAEPTDQELSEAGELYVGTLKVLEAWMPSGGFPETVMLDRNPIAMLLMRKFLIEMVEAGEVFKDGHGNYLITEKGLAVIADYNANSSRKSGCN